MKQGVQSQIEDSGWSLGLVLSLWIRRSDRCGDATSPYTFLCKALEKINLGPDVDFGIHDCSSKKCGSMSGGQDLWPLLSTENDAWGCERYGEPTIDSSRYAFMRKPSSRGSGNEPFTLG